jgi:hypothetical protein
MAMWRSGPNGERRGRLRGAIRGRSSKSMREPQEKIGQILSYFPATAIAS